MRVAVHNLGPRSLGHNPRAVARWLDAEGNRLHIDAWFLSETSRYVRALDRLPDWTLITDRSSRPDADGSALLVHHETRLRGKPRSLYLRLRWWGFKHKIWRAPRTMTHARVGWARMLAAHLPPGGPDSRNSRPWHEQRRRIAAWVKRRRLAYPNRPVLVGGDWNARLDRLGDLARLGDLRMVGIDGLLAVGCRIAKLERHPAPYTDHKPGLLVYTLERTPKEPIMRGTITHRVTRAARRRGVTVYTRRRWGSKYAAVYAWRRKNKPHALLPDKPADTLVQHITVTRITGDFPADARTVERIGYERFKSGISYNWLWHPITGDVAQGMPLDAKGTHTVNDKNVPGYSHDQNAVALAVAMLGMPGVRPTQKALDKLAALIAAHIEVGALTPGHDYVPHSLFAAKDCPTQAMRDVMGAVNDAAREQA